MKCLKEVDLISFQYPIETQSNFQRNINLWIPALCAPAFAFVCNTHKKEEEEANLTCRTPCHATAYASNQRIDLPWFIQAKQSHLPTANKGIYQSRPDPLRPTAADKQQRRESKKKKITRIIASFGSNRRSPSAVPSIYIYVKWYGMRLRWFTYKLDDATTECQWWRRWR